MPAVHRLAPCAAGALLVVSLSGCGALLGARAPDLPGGASCDPSGDVTHADPWVAFEPAAQQGDELAVGERTYLFNVKAADVTVEGEGAVRLTDEESATRIACGRTESTSEWLEITGERPGPVRMTSADGSQFLELTVTP